MNRTLLFILFLSSSLKAYCFVNAGTIPSVTTGCAPLIVNFTDNSSSTNTISTWAYSFGDGGTSSQSNPKYVYSVAGKYRVILEVKDVNGNSDKDTVYIVVKRGPNANFSTPNASYCNNISIPFKNLSTDGDTGIRNCTWDFGDGQTATAKGDVTKAYSKEGTFNVILTVRDYNGCVNTIIKNNFITINPTPKADFTFNQIYSCTAPMNVNFKNKSTKNPTYVWDLGDGNTTTDANPSTAYGTEKKYNITLTATTSNGCMDVKTAILNVKFGEIKANFSMVSDVGCIPFTPGFTSTTKPDSVFFNYAWSFGDNTTSSAENPNKSYNKVGTYTIKLKVSGVGCSDSINKTLLVSDRPKPILKASDTLGCHGVLSTTLSAKCKLGNKWTWYIDGKNIENQTGVLNYYFGDTGIYKVIVQVDDSANCSETVQFTKMVVQDLKADWYFPDTNSCAPFYPGIKNTTFNALNAKLSYAWQQHDGKRTYIKIPTPYYPDTGKFNMRLIVKDQYGCMDSLEQIIPVGKRIKPDFTIDKTKVCIGEKVKFVNTTNSVLAKLVNIWYWQLGNIISSEKDSVITKLTQIPAFVNLMLVAEHNGCRTFIKKDTALMMQGAFANFDFSFDTCYSHNVRLRNASDSFTSIKWVMPDNSVRNDFEFTYAANPNADSKIRLIAYNTRTKCTDSITKVFGVPKSVSDIYYYFKPDCTPQMVTFYNKSYGAYRTHWEFGNGDTTDLLINKGDSFRYTYTSPGDFKIVLQGWDNKGCLYESSKILSIKGPAVESKVWPLKGCLPLTINLKDSNSNATIKKKFWLINYKDTVRISKKGPITTFTINEMPLYDSLVSFTLVVMDSNGCVSSKTHHVRPYGPKADVLITRKTSCDAMRCYFNAEIDSISTALPVKITWNLGDGNNVYNSTKAEHIYGTEGYYYPVYTMTDAAGCVYEEKLVLYSTEPVLLAKFGIANNIGKCPPLLAEFTDRSIQNGSPIEEYLWDLGEGYISYEQNPGKLFTHSGNFDIKLYDCYEGCTYGWYHGL
ncbi:MAG: PKD domain-containing protein, partial [bacterium]|nr:PKD domain-containing protein [bacterium]